MRGRRSRADAKNAVSCCIGSTNKTKIGGLRTPFQLLSLSSFEANTCFFSSFLGLHSDPSNYGIFACIYHEIQWHDTKYRYTLYCKYSIHGLWICHEILDSTKKLRRQEGLPPMTDRKQAKLRIELFEGHRPWVFRKTWNHLGKGVENMRFDVFWRPSCG